MPIHEYTCKKCGEKFAISGSFSFFVDFVVTCPTCGSEDITKMLFPTNVIYKGNGFTKKVENKKASPTLDDGEDNYLPEDIYS